MNIVQLERLSKNIKVFASEEKEQSKLRVLRDEKSYRLAQNIFKTYCAPNTDYSEFHNFLRDLDRLLSRFGGQSPTNPQRKKDKGDKPYKSKAENPDE